MPGSDAESRDDHGRWTAGAGLAKWVAGKIDTDGGLTYKPDAPSSERTPKDGYMVGYDSKTRGHVIEHREMLKEMLTRSPRPSEAAVHAEIQQKTEQQVRDWLTKAIPAARALGPGHYIGGWKEVDKATGETIALHLDISQKVSTRSEAISLGQGRNQNSVWDVAKGEEIDTGGTGR
jgi:hypothetical protein